MPIPGQTLTIRDPGLGLVEPSVNIPVFIGVCSSGTNYNVYQFSSLNTAQSTLGQGPLAEAVCRTLQLAGGPVYAIKVADDTLGTVGAVTPHRIGASTGTITIATTPVDSYVIRVNITKTGALGTAKFRYSLDNGRTYSDELVMPGGGTYLMPGTGLTLTFVVGGGPVFFENGDYHTATSTCAYFTTVVLGTAITALRASTANYTFIVLCGKASSATNGATMFGALETHLATLETDFRYVRAMMDSGTDSDTNVITAYSAVDNSRITVGYSTHDCTSAKPMAGWGTPKVPIINTLAALATKNLISTDLARVASGSLDGVVAIDHDEYKTETLDSQRISTLRTWPGRDGFYVTNCKIKSAPGSDFRYWQHGRIMDVACTVTVNEQTNFVGMGLRSNPNGTINELDARRLESIVLAALRNELLSPANIEGTRGHISDLSYKIDRTNNIVTTETLLAEVAIRPFGYVKYITTTIGFSLKV